jgi:transmembrane sensor
MKDMIFKESNTKDWEEIAKFVANELKDEELEKFQERVNFSECNKNIVKQVKRDWEAMENNKNKKEFDANNAWDKLHAKFEQDGLLNKVQTLGKKSNFQIVYRIAAILIIGILLASVIYYLSPDKINYQVADTYQNKEISKVTLADGSVVYLNANSKLYYPEKFEGKARQVEFEGDAFFEITKNPAKPFIIKAKGAEIKVLGTSFNVNTNLVSKDVEVLVETGKVKFTSLQNQKYKLLLPGDLGTLVKDNVYSIKNTDKNYLSWKTKCFYFSEGIKLSDAIEMLNRAYHKNIVCRDINICNKKIYTTHPNEPLKKVLDIICESQSLNWTEINNEIILTAK